MGGHAARHAGLNEYWGACKSVRYAQNLMPLSPLLSFAHPGGYEARPLYRPWPPPRARHRHEAKFLDARACPSVSYTSDGMARLRVGEGRDASQLEGRTDRLDSPAPQTLPKVATNRERVLELGLRP